jgi:hypothetical protein
VPVIPIARILKMPTAPLVAPLSGEPIAADHPACVLVRWCSEAARKRGSA